MEWFLIILIAAAIMYWKMGPGSDNAKAVKRLTNGKTEEQKKTIEYFCREGCGAKTISDDEYVAMVRSKLDKMNLKERALSQIGLDEDEVNEIPPVVFEGWVYKNAYAKKTAKGDWVSSSYQVSWIFFGSAEIYLYSYTFNMDDDNKREVTNEYFYRDVTSFNTISETDKAHGINGETFDVSTDQLAMVVPGDKFYLSMVNSKDAASSIQAMKQKLREKKQ